MTTPTTITLRQQTAAHARLVAAAQNQPVHDDDDGDAPSDATVTDDDRDDKESEAIIAEAEKMAKQMRAERRRAEHEEEGALRVHVHLTRDVIDRLQADARRDGHTDARLDSSISKDTIVQAYKHILPDLPQVAAITVIASPLPHHYDVHAVRIEDVEATGGVDKLHAQCAKALRDQEPGYLAGLLAKTVAHRRTRGAGTAEQMSVFPCDLTHFDFAAVCTTFAY